MNSKLLMVVACAAALQAVSANKYQKFEWEKTTYVPFDAATTVTLECPDPAAAKWLEAHYAQWYGESAPKVKVGATGLKPEAGDEAYAASTDSSGVKIAANTLAGTRWASYTLRQLAIAKRGTVKSEGYLLPKLKMTDRPHLAFRAIHLCWFPEVRPQQIERAIRLAALMKYNYAIIEPWGMYKSEKNPWWGWPQANMTKAEIRRLVAIGKDIGITLVPQINCYGHASAARGCTIKHSVLDLHPEYEPLFEPGGWCWCISNPETQRVLRELIAEMHEDFGNPPFFHIGCDEAFGAQTCPECVKHPKDELLLKHISGLAEFVRLRGAQAMMWHDMLLDVSDPRWKGFIKYGNKETASILDKLPKDIIICDWQYWKQIKGNDGKPWPTMTHFKEKGFPVVACPWMNGNVMKSMSDHIVNIGGFGFIETTWHHLRGQDWENMYKWSGFAAWGSPVSHDVPFQRSLRLIGNDMKVTDYQDTGFLNYQVPPAWWAH